MSGTIQPMARDSAWFRRGDEPQSPPSWRGHIKGAMADTCYLSLRVSGWLAVTALAALGTFMLFFLLLGNMTAIGFFSQIANLGTRFVAADAARRESFMLGVEAVSAIVFAAIAIARIGVLTDILADAKGRAHD